MKNLIRLPISQIRHNKSEVLMIRLNKTIIYENMGCLEYTVDSYNNSFGSYGMPKVYSDTDNYEQINYRMVELILHDGTITTDMNTPCYQIEKVKLWFKPSTYRISFDGSESHKYVVKTIENCDTSYLQNMRLMFYYCKDLTTVNTKDWDTSNVISMYQMFAYCESLTSLNLSNWNVENLTSTSFMFYDCYYLTTIGDISNWNTKNLDATQWMFHDCGSLTSLNLSNWNTEKLTNTTNMFEGCANLTSLNLSNWKLSSDVVVSYMFDGCTKLQTVRLDYCDNITISKIIEELPERTGTSNIIHCKQSQAQDLEPPSGWSFSFIEESEEPDISPVEPEEPEETEEPTYYIEYTVDNDSTNPLNGGTYEYNYGLPRIYTDSSTYSFDGYLKIEITKTDGTITTDTSITCNNVSKVKLWYPKDTHTIKFYANSTYAPEIKTLKFYDTPALKTGIQMFYNCNKLTSLDMSGWDVGNLTGKNDLLLMLGCPSLTDFEAPKNIHANFDVSGCPNLTTNSLLSIINNLATVDSTVGYTLTLGAENGAKLNSSDINTAESKGWVVYYS